MVKGDGEVKRTVKWRAVIQGTDWHQQGIDKPVPQYDKYPSSCRVKVKVFHYSLGQALRVPGGWGSQISRQSAHKGGKVVSPKHRPPLLPRKYSWYSFLLETESTAGAWCGRKDYVKIKFPMTPSGIEPATFRLVAQCVSELRKGVEFLRGLCGNVATQGYNYMRSILIWTQNK